MTYQIHIVKNLDNFIVLVGRMKIKVIELFAGSCSFSNVAKDYGYKTFTTDFEPFDGIDLVADILDLEAKDFPFQPDIVWASPPCTTFSIASCGTHWFAPDENGNRSPKTDASGVGVQIVEKTRDLIKELNPTYFIIENPRGILRKLDLLSEFHRDQVSYCKYGDTRMKPTDLWHNLTGFEPRMCKNGMPCHESAPRGSRTGTQGIVGDFNRSKVPDQLCEEILALCK